MATDPAINDLVHRYCDAVVRKDTEQWAATWAPDASWDLTGGRVTHGRDAIVEMWIAAMTRFDIVIQLAHNGAATTDDKAGTGQGRWYFTESMQVVGGERRIMIGYYNDTYIKVDGEWLFASRALEILYRGPADLSGTFSLSA
jgi:SnoaL-like domain